MHQISGNVRKCSSYYVFAGSCQKYGSQCLYILKPLIITAVPWNIHPGAGLKAYIFFITGILFHVKI